MRTVCGVEQSAAENQADSVGSRHSTHSSDLLTVSYIRTGAGVSIILATIWLARRIDARLSRAA